MRIFIGLLSKPWVQRRWMLQNKKSLSRSQVKWMFDVFDDLNDFWLIGFVFTFESSHGYIQSMRRKTTQHGCGLISIKNEDAAEKKKKFTWGSCVSFAVNMKEIPSVLLQKNANYLHTTNDKLRNICHFFNDLARSSYFRVMK